MYYLQQRDEKGHFQRVGSYRTAEAAQKAGEKLKGRWRIVWGEGLVNRLRRNNRLTVSR